MDYVVGSVAALVTGNVTPNRPKFLKRALTPTKHQPSPNVTPKSELVDDRSIFLSPTLQKKKAVVKKSPKRIFENPDLDVTNEDGSTKSKSPKAEKVKKHLKEDLDADLSPKSLKNKSPKIKDVQSQNTEDENMDISGSPQLQNESTPKKKKKKQSLTTESIDNINTSNDNIKNKKKLVSPLKNKKGKNKTAETDGNKENDQSHTNESQNNTDTEVSPITVSNILNNEEESKNKKKGKKKNKKQKKLNNVTENTEPSVTDNTEAASNTSTLKKKKNKPIVNPNAITDKDSDSEHDSDDDIDSEDEQNNKEVLDTGPAESSEDEEEKPEKKEKVQKKEVVVNTEEEVKRTLFVGNVPFSPKCKKEIKKIFSKYGQIETVRIRTIPVKDGRATPKIAVIKNELHPDRSTVNVYVKFADASSVNEALAENGTVLNDHHLRVTRSDCTGSEHDPKCSIFIGNLPFALEDEALQQKFQQCGEIESVRIIRDKKTSAGKGFGYVNFKSKDAVELALALSEEELTIKNRIIRVKRCTQTNTKQKPQRDNQRGNFRGRGNTRGGFGRGNTQGGFSRGNDQGGFGRGSDQGGFGRGISRGGFGRGTSRGGFGRGNTRGGFGRGSSLGGFGRGNVQGGEQFGNRDERQVGRSAYNDSKADGAMRRLMKKRTNQDGGEGPPNKMQKISQPGKKQRKEFVGMTAEKKKKNKFDKGQKKKKALSEILTK